MVYYRRRYGVGRVVRRITFVSEVATATEGKKAELIEMLKKASVVVAAALFALLLAACVEVVKTGPKGDPGEPAAPAPVSVCVPGDDPIAVPTTIGAGGFVRRPGSPHEGTYEHRFTLPADEVLRARVWIQRPGETHPSARRHIVGGTTHGTTYTLEVTPMTGKVQLHLVGHGYGHELPPSPPPIVERIEQRLASSHPGAAVLDYAVAALAGVRVYVRVCPPA